MSRLKHSASALLRAFQVSQREIFIVVEGREFDRYAYGRIAHAVCRPYGISYQLISARELPGATGGKRSVIKFFRYARRYSRLVLTLGSRKRAIVFYVDKDIDDICRKKLTSDHLRYTQTYDLEGDIILHGNVLHAVSIALSNDPMEVASTLGDQRMWLRSFCIKWLDWVAICIYVHWRKLPTRGYSSLSPVNRPLEGNTDPVALRAELQHLQGLSGLSTAAFNEEFRSVQRLVRKLYRRGYHSLVFKGKWYLVLFDRELRRIFPHGSCNLQQLPARISSSLLTGIDYSGEWARRYREPLELVISLLRS